MRQCFHEANGTLFPSLCRGNKKNNTTKMLLFHCRHLLSSMKSVGESETQLSRAYFKLGDLLHTSSLTYRRPRMCQPSKWQRALGSVLADPTVRSFRLHRQDGGAAAKNRQPSTAQITVCNVTESIAGAMTESRSESLSSSSKHSLGGDSTAIPRRGPKVGTAR